MQSKILCAVTFFMTASLSVLHAQNVETEFGIKGGLNMSNLYTDDADDENVLFGFNAGVYATLPVSDFVAIQPELLFTTRGSELEYNIGGANQVNKYKFNYIELPLLVRVNLTKNFNIHAGGYASYMVSSKVTGEGTIDFENEFDTDDFNKFDAGLAAGVGLDFNPISVGVRYNYGLTTIVKDGDDSSDLKNSNLSLYLSYKLN
ncbi:outer membrane beta-barrel protein [Flavobacterium sp. GA093]|uniref:Outer membrane beta-barrel protein n=2 Tax=Flavobacterium hydrocarbonoxydans TaxID=2683249 RepID=A0A6I4NSR8_9FLAO|nr:outer membrane beta-barrel protein [Flavobacterium hydrocarbonoxydans]